MSTENSGFRARASITLSAATSRLVWRSDHQIDSTPRGETMARTHVGRLIAASLIATSAAVSIVAAGWLGVTTPAVGAIDGPDASYWTGLVDRSFESDRPPCDSGWEPDPEESTFFCSRLAHPPRWADGIAPTLTVEVDERTDRIRMLYFRFEDYTPPVVPAERGPGRLKSWADVVAIRLGTADCLQQDRRFVRAGLARCPARTIAHLQAVDPETDVPVAHLWIGDRPRRVADALRDRADDERRRLARTHLAAATDYLEIGQPDRADQKLDRARELLVAGSDSLGRTSSATLFYLRKLRFQGG